QLQDINGIPDILKMFESKNNEVKMAAVQALTNFKNLGHHFFNQSFAKYRVIESLKTLFITTRSKKIKSDIMKVFHNIHHEDVVPFLLENLKTNDPQILSNIIHVCGLFKDLNSAYYLEKYLQYPHPRVRSSAIIALWNFPVLRLKCLIQLSKMLEDKGEEIKISAIYAIGEIKAIQEIPRLEKLLETNSPILRSHVLIALIKLGQIKQIPNLINLILSSDHYISETCQKLIKKLENDLSQKIHNFLKQEVAQKIHQVLKKANSEILEDIPQKYLYELSRYYKLISEIKEELKIEQEIEKRKLMQ
ncbi:MAG TPA: hypothetical protein PLQ36_04325, partial [Candidatus Gracilibacteria bacterium]|nr:hypothetical protein [Candidatus Gracilibacteria bacterium]